MPWKSREDKLPPSSFFSMMVAYLQQAYPGARISRELMMTLRPFLIEAWRNGRSAEAAAQTTCSCDGRHVVPSPVVAVHIAKGSVRPPRGAQRGEVFGAEELRPPAHVERLQRQIDRVSRKEQKQQTQVARWEQRAQRARTDSARRHGAERKQAEVTAQRADLLAEAKRMEAELQRLRQELNRSSSRRPELAAVSRPVAPTVETIPPSIAPKETAPPPPVRNSAVPAASPTTGEDPSPRKRKPRGRPRSAATPAKSAPSADAAVKSESAAMLSAIQGLLPNLAAQLAAQLAKDGAAQ